MGAEVVCNCCADAKAEAIRIGNRVNIGRLDSGIGLIIAVRIVTRFIDREIRQSRGFDRKGLAQQADRIIDAEREDHFEYVIAADVVAARKRRNLDSAQEHVLHEREPQRLEHAQGSAGFLHIVRPFGLWQTCKQAVELETIDTQARRKPAKDACPVITGQSLRERCARSFKMQFP